MQNVESFLDNLFYNSAKEKESEMKGKKYKYKKLANDYCTVIKTGTCTITSRNYNKSLDCDVLNCVDIDTKETFSCNQFRIDLFEIKD